MELREKLIKLLPELDVVRKLLVEYPSEIYVFSRAYHVFSAANERINSNEDIANCLVLMRALRDRLWEIINTGQYSTVAKVHRQAYTLATACQVALVSMKYKENDTPSRRTIENCIYDLDYGLLLGYPFDGLLTNYMSELEKYLTHNTTDADRTDFLECNAIRSENESKMCQVDILKCPSIELFQNGYFSKRSPVIIANCMDQWPALTKWSNPTYLIKVAGDRTVPIEIGSHYTNDDWAQDMVKLKDFIRRQFLDVIVDQPIEYLAQHNLFDQIPQLRHDIVVPEYCCVSDTDCEIQLDIKAWVGPKGTISPMHHDPKHNLLCQVFGHKRIILAAPEEAQNLYPHENDMLSNTSLIDAENLDLDKFPLVSKVKFYELTLYKGEMLYIPPKWWHYVRSLEKSFSVSFWWE